MPHHYETQELKIELRRERRKAIEECARVARSFTRDPGVTGDQKVIAERIREAILLRLGK